MSGLAIEIKYKVYKIVEEMLVNSHVYRISKNFIKIDEKSKKNTKCFVKTSNLKNKNSNRDRFIEIH